MTWDSLISQHVSCVFHTAWGNFKGAEVKVITQRINKNRFGENACKVKIELIKMHLDLKMSNMQLFDLIN